MDREALERLVAEGLSTRSIAERVGKAQTTVRYWLRRHGLRTARAETRNVVPVELRGEPIVELDCVEHGRARFVLRPDGGYRCLQCRSDQVSRRRRQIKETLVREAGGRCVLCGYGRYAGALHFHHVDPETKAFALATGGLVRSLAAARAEARKCVLLCANCHAEVEAGFADILDGSAGKSVYPA